jgi:hypothetical protein
MHFLYTWHRYVCYKPEQYLNVLVILSYVALYPWLVKPLKGSLSVAENVVLPSSNLYVLSRIIIILCVVLGTSKTIFVANFLSVCMFCPSLCLIRRCMAYAEHSYGYLFQTVIAIEFVGADSPVSVPVVDSVAAYLPS